MSLGSVFHTADRPARTFGFRKHKFFGQGTEETAFTLVEVAFCLGIVSFAFVGMVGLMAVGLTTLRQSMDLNTETSITQKLSGEAQELDYSQVTNTNSSYRSNFQHNRYFDEYGSELTNNPTPTGYVYAATLTVANCQLPGMTSNSPVAQQLIFNVTTPRQPGATNSFYLWAVDNGR